MTKYLHNWADTGEAGMLEDFSIDKAALEGAEVLVASYSYEDYSGDAFVLLKRGDDLFEVNGSHCSCYGLSEIDYCGDSSTQWELEPTSVETLIPRLDRNGFDPEVADAIRAAIVVEQIRPAVENIGEAEKAKRTILAIEIPRDELAFRIMQKAVGLVPPPGMTWQEAKAMAEAGQPGMWAIFLAQADAAVLYFYEVLNAARQPS